jgi:hypothetical protein
MPLDPERIKQIYADRRTKGLYMAKLRSFMESGDLGISVKEEWNTEFEGKKASTLKQGFENAKDNKLSPDGSELIDVIVEGEDVFLINRLAAEQDELVAPVGVEE